MSSARFRAPEFPLRPLLYVAGAAAAVTGVYYCMKKRDAGQKRHTGTSKLEPLTEDPVQTVSLLDPGLVCDEATHSDCVVPENSERSNLEKRVKELKERLCEIQRECERKAKDYAAVCDAHTTLKSLYNEMKETFAHNEELLKNFQAALAGTDEKYMQVMKSNAQLKIEKLDLMSQVDTLQGSVSKMEEELCESCRTRDETLRKLVIGKGILMFVKTKAALQVKTVNQRAEELQVWLEEVQKKYDGAVNTIHDLERGQLYLESEVNEQHEIINVLEDELSQSQTSCSSATCEMERLTRQLTDLDSKWNLLNEIVLTNYGELSEDHLKLFRQYNELKEEHDHLQTVKRVEAMAAYEQVMESNAQLENKNSELMYHIHKLRGRVQQLEEMLYEADLTRGVLKQDRERAEEAYNNLTSQYKETLKH